MPDKVMLLTLIAVESLFDRVTTFCALLLPTGTDAQLKLDGEGVTDAIAATPPSALKPRADVRSQTFSDKDFPIRRFFAVRRMAVKAVGSGLEIEAGRTATFTEGTQGGRHFEPQRRAEDVERRAIPSLDYDYALVL